MEETIIDPSCPTGWNEKKLIGGGSYSTIHKVCCGDNCNFVLKRNRPYETKNLKKEATAQAKCADAGLCPKVYYSSKTEYIMDKLDFTVSTLLRQYRDPVVNELIVKSLFDLLDRLHQIGLVHGDLHFANIMVKDENPELERLNEEHNIQMSEIERYNQHNYRYYFIDLSGIQKPPGTSPSDDMFLDDWDLLIGNIRGMGRPYLDPLILEKMQELIDVSITDPETGVSNLMILVLNHIISAALLRRLIENISPEVINWQDHEGNTVLHHLAAHRYINSIPTYKMLIWAGADPKIKNHGGYTALDYERNPQDLEYLRGL